MCRASEVRFMPLSDSSQREIAERLKRRADLYQNAGDGARADLVREAADRALDSDSFEDALQIEATATRSPRGFFRRLWDRFRGSDESDDS